MLAEIGPRSAQIDRGIPGESVEVRVEVGRKPLRGVVTEVLEASSWRVSAPCPYYHAGCGGCQWQHVSYPGQVETKKALVDRAMEAAGVNARVQAVFAMDDPWRYRRTAAIALGWEAGFRPQRRRGIVEINDCPISHPLIGELAAQLNGVLRESLLPNYHGKVWLDCTVVGSPDTPALQVLIQGIAGLTLESHPELAEVARTIATLHGVESVAFRHRSGEPRALVGDLMATIDVLGKPMWLPAGSFFQTNLEMIELVLRQMQERLAVLPVRTAADIYGGVGTFAMPLAPLVESMALIELDPYAVEAARRSAADRGLSNLTFTSMHAEKALPILPVLDLAIVDPPRSGLGETVTRALTENGVPHIFYVSCSPLSLARDLAELEGSGYRVEYLGIYDFYPQTYHVESFAVLRR